VDDERSTSDRPTRRSLTFGAGLSALLAGVGLSAPTAEAKKGGKRKKRKKRRRVRVVERLVARQMLGENEIPDDSGDPDAEGSAVFTFKSNGQICCDFFVEGLAQGDFVTAIHIHAGASDEEGPPVVDFSAFADEADLAGCVNANQQVFDDILASPTQFYANLHTGDFPDGAVRDQLDFEDV
jgi:hypothetical protein